MPWPRLHDDQVDIDEGLVRRLLAGQHPELAVQPLTTVTSGGTDNAVYRLGQELAVRLPLRPEAVGGLLTEIRYPPVVAPHLPLPVPEVVVVGEPTDAYPFPWAVVRWLAGEDAATGRAVRHGLRRGGL